ncbi:unnamed protein product, partial [Polarella glacialis]
MGQVGSLGHGTMPRFAFQSVQLAIGTYRQPCQLLAARHFRPNSRPSSSNQVQPDGKRLNELIKIAKSSEDLFDVVSDHKDRLDAVHAAACLWRLSKLGSPLDHLVGRQPFLELLLLVDQHLTASVLGTRGLSNILVAIAHLAGRSGAGSSDCPQLQVLACRCAKEFSDPKKLLRANAHDVANSAWAAARLLTLCSSNAQRQQSHELTDLLLRLGQELERKQLVEAFTAQGLANVAWAYATAAGLPGGLLRGEQTKVKAEIQQQQMLQRLFHMVAEAAIPKLQPPVEFNPQEMFGARETANGKE